MSKYLRELDDKELNESTKIKGTEEFELLYLRHRYFRMSENPSPERLAMFEDTVIPMSNAIFYRNKSVFDLLGMGSEDIANIARVHAVSFITMSGLYENPEKMEKFLKAHKKLKGKKSIPTDKDRIPYEMSQFSRFLKQRFIELVKWSKRKNQSIRGSGARKGFYVGSPDRSPTNDDLFTHPEAFGYESITESQYKKLVKETKPTNANMFFNKQGQAVRRVYLEGSFLTHDDIEESYLDPRNNWCYRDPEDNAIINESYEDGSIKKYYKDKNVR